MFLNSTNASVKYVLFGLGCLADSDGTRNRDYSVAVIAVVSVVLVTFILLGVFAVVVEKER